MIIYQLYKLLLYKLLRRFGYTSNGKFLIPRAINDSFDNGIITDDPIIYFHYKWFKLRLPFIFNQSTNSVPIKSDISIAKRIRFYYARWKWMRTIEKWNTTHDCIDCIYGEPCVGWNSTYFDKEPTIDTFNLMEKKHD